jgi:transcriptional regulator with XRE-family HTH domain
MKRRPTPLAILLDAKGRRRGTLTLVPGAGPGEAGLPRLDQAGLARLLRDAGAIRSDRLAEGITQQELAAVLGVSQPMLSRLERNPTPRALGRLRAALEAIRESRRLWQASPQRSLEDLLAAQRPLAELALSRKRRAEEERELLAGTGDPVADLEREGRTKTAGARPERPRRKMP